MSRIGKAPITLPSGTTVTVGDEVTVKGPKGQLSRPLVDGTSISQEEGVVTVARESEQRHHRANHGLMRALLNNMVIGVSSGFSKKLEIVGVGYKVDLRGKNLVFQLGYSHVIDFPLPAGIDAVVEDRGATVTVSGIDKEVVGQTAAVIRGFRPPDSYKGKGVRYSGEYVRIKAGKAAKA
jgi:large subunit ribosomal protein L6